MALATSIISCAWVYAGLGAVVAGIFLTTGIGRIDAAARGSLAFRPLLIPGLVLLWPIVIKRWIDLERHLPTGEH